MSENLPTNGHHPLDVLEFLAERYEAGLETALVIITDVNGGAMRARGALMAVTPHGQTCGYVSNGCVDADIVAHAQSALNTGDAMQLRYGEGSPFRDITLPCGGRIDLRVLPRPDKKEILLLRDRLASRNPATLNIDNQSRLSQTGISDDFSVTYQPKLKIRIVGNGDALIEMAQQAQNLGCDVKVFSPDENLLEQLTDYHTVHMNSASNLPPLGDDPHTAVVLLFHDHAWESEILRQALAGPAFYIGAMGSPKTHALRRDMLKSIGLDQKNIDRVRGPIGLIPSSRSANLLALSTLAEIIQAAQQQDLL